MTIKGVYFMKWFSKVNDNNLLHDELWSNIITIELRIPYLSTLYLSNQRIRHHNKAFGRWKKIRESAWRYRIDYYYLVIISRGFVIDIAVNAYDKVWQWEGKMSICIAICSA